MFSRDSSPIISRRQNPGLIYEYQRPPVSHFHLQSIKTGYFHESNGQTVDTIEEYRTINNAADYVSRGWDYIPLALLLTGSAEAHTLRLADGKNVSLAAQLKAKGEKNWRVILPAPPGQQGGKTLSPADADYLLLGVEETPFH